MLGREGSVWSFHAFFLEFPSGLMFCGILDAVQELWGFQLKDSHPCLSLPISWHLSQSALLCHARISTASSLGLPRLLAAWPGR